MADLLFTWFNYSQMKQSEDKCHVILSSHDNVHVNIGTAQIENRKFASQFNYYLRTWMFHNRKLNNKINRLHERCLQLIYSDRISSYEELVDKGNSVPIHQKNLQKLATEMFKTYTGIAPQIMTEVFPKNYALNYNLRCHPKFPSRVINAVHLGSDSLKFLGPKIWEMLPLDLKNSDSLYPCKSGIKN